MLNLARLLTLGCLCAGFLLSWPGSAAANASNAVLIDPASTTLTLDEQLALKYAPVAVLKTQTKPCDTIGEPYAPTAVDVIFGNPLVKLRKRTSAKKAKDDPVAAVAPDAAALAGKNGDYYIDLPGSPLDAGCTYEHFFKDVVGDEPPLAYAHIAREPGKDGIALQYWFYYVFNRFNNLHESDWEGIQILFSANSVEEALTTDPYEVAFAQHGGGEAASWDSGKLQRTGDHPIVFPASGSHATYYDREIYVGWGEHGSGLGCDDTTGPSTRVPLRISLLPDIPPATGPFAWLSFSGPWGEKEPSVFNGPTGPYEKDRWSKPFSWEDDLRKSSVPLLGSTTVGFGPARLLCALVPYGSDIFILHIDYRLVSYGVVAVLLGLPLLLLALAWSTLWAAFRFFIRHGLTFLMIGSVLFVIGTGANLLQAFMDRFLYLHYLLELLNIPITQGIFFEGGSTLQQLAGWVLVTPAVIHCMVDIQAGRKPSFFRAYRFAFDNAWHVLRASLQATLILALLVLSVVGIPFAVVRVVRWMLLTQAVALDHAHWHEARRFSELAIRSRWWRSAMLAAAITIINALIAPILGLIVLVFVTPSTLVAQTVSSVTYSLLFPMVGIATTFWYLKRRSAVQELLPSPSV